MTVKMALNYWFSDGKMKRKRRKTCMCWRVTGYPSWSTPAILGNIRGMTACDDGRDIPRGFQCILFI